MNLFIPQAFVKSFEKTFKNLPFIVDYKLDGFHLDKQKYAFSFDFYSNQHVESLLSVLPPYSILTHQLKPPGKEYVLCVGEVDFHSFSRFQSFEHSFSIITKQEEQIRVNFWIHYSNLHSLYEQKLVRNLSTVNQQIKDFVFILLVPEESIDPIVPFLSEKTEFIIKDMEIYVNVNLTELSELLKETLPYLSYWDFMEEYDFR